MQFLELVDLAAERLGGRVLDANDEFFAGKENLLKASTPVFIEGKFTDRGKWMDGWETRRRRTPGHDWCVLQLGLPGILRGVVVDTAFFRGNYPEHCSIEASADGVNWTEVLPKSPLKGDSQNLFAIEDPHRYVFLRLNIYPDGGVARLRVFGEVIPDRSTMPEIIDLASVVNGAMVLSASDMFFGHRHNLIMPGPALNMGDGWETKRRRGPGHDWCVVKLAGPGMLRKIEVDTSHFKGNYPDTCSIDAAAGDAAAGDDGPFQTILPKTKLEADTIHVFEKQLYDAGRVSRVRLNIYPDGGVARLRVWGTLA
jgi:allantoicase